MADLTPERIAERLASHRADQASRLFRRAAVAAVLRFDRGAEVLLIERAVREGDRWSGHVSFPGGLESPADADLFATAVRETREEVGLDLERAGRPLGRLAPVRAMARGNVLPMTITPFVFQLDDQAFTPSPNHEVAGWFWLPLAEATSGALDARYDYKLGPVPLHLPCWRYQGHTVWGLTYQMLRALLEVIG